jgi:Raf kinase inhibitor-like YbhB/YbcL family protein
MRGLALGVLLGVMAVSFLACAPKETRAPASLVVRSSAFSAGGEIPARFTCEGPNGSPELSWSGIPAGAKSLALLCDDPDAPVGTWVHWVLYDLPASERGLPEGIQAAAPPGARHGKNSWDREGYGGPCPPPGKPHRYFFRLYALDTPLGLPAGAIKDQVLKAMEGRVLARGELMGTYARKG